MSVLELSGRPFVIFDPANTDHRKFYYGFVKKGTWGGCPYRFVVPEDHGNLVTMIQRSLIAHYVQNEFERPKKVAQKGKKTVDIKSKR